MNCKLILSITILSLLCVSALSKTKSKSVTTLLDAKWEAKPLVLEVAEYLAEENVDFYWSFIDAVSDLKPPLTDLGTDKNKYDAVMEIATKFVSESQLSILKMGLALHIYSPKIEMFSQIAVEKELPDCLVIADIAGKVTCQLDEAENRLKNIIDSENVEKIDIYRVDTHYPGSENRSIAVVLYGELGTKEFASFHSLLKNYALKGHIDYIVRHLVKEHSKRQQRLSGYGVELQMKSTEYKVQDDTQLHDDEASEEEDEDSEVQGFYFAKLKRLFPESKDDLDRFRHHLEEISGEMAPLKVWQFQELSLQAAERIMAAPRDEALKVFTNIAQNFPMQAKSLVKTVVTSELKNEIKKNQDIFSTSLNLQASDTALFINGMYFDLDLTDIYTVFETLRQEIRTMEGLHRIGVPNEQITSLLALDLSDASRSEDFAMDIRDSAINWINNIEEDPQYTRWGSSVMELLKPTFPGMLRQVRKNLFNLVLIINPASTESRGILNLVESLVVHSAPLRVGLVFAVNPDVKVSGVDDAGIATLCAYNYIAQNENNLKALNFLTSLLSLTKDREVTVEDVKKQLGKKYSTNILDIIGEESSYDFGRQLANDFIQRSGLANPPQALLNGVPLQSSQLNPDDFEEAILQEVMGQTAAFQRAIFRGKLTDKHDVLDYLMSQPSVMPRLNQRILNKDNSFYLDMSGKAATSLNTDDLLKLFGRDMTATAIENVRYFSVFEVKPLYHTLTCWVIGDLDCPKTRKLFLASLEHLKVSDETRVSFLPNVDGNKDNLLNKIVLAALEVLSSKEAIKYITPLLNDDTIIRSENFVIPSEIAAQIDSQELSLKMLRVYAQRVLKFKVGERGVVANGRVLGPFSNSEDFTVEDFALLERYSYLSYGAQMVTALVPSDITSNTFLRMVPLLVSRSQTRTRFDIITKNDEYSVLKFPPKDPEKPVFQITAIVDPVSRGAQKLGSILQVFQEVLNCHIHIYMNSVEKNSGMPLKSFYRFVFEAEIQFTNDGKQALGPIAKFTNMPTAPLLTQNIHVPENWMVEVVRSVYDLDNIRLENVDSVVHSEYELEYLLVEGHCFEATSGSPPRGLQITLGTAKQPVVVDTIVMANLGYFQLKAKPGAWILRLRQGRSADIYDIVSHEGSDTPVNSTDIKVLISSLRSNVLKLKVTKKPEMYNMDLLSEDEPSAGLWNSITSSFSGTEEDADEKLNIFSLASGHLYERFIRIMMLSVLKHTRKPVKFWFLKNYLSPQLKDFLPYMAKEYKFEFELVQYKWPRWLHQQTEKQRIIWGYKILFLDVLFPLDVKKIIFVDADQVVRADLYDLQQFDLGGAPYGYTPFCDSRKEMDGFRFWKQGYWRTHLQGRRYHISALYVVDLKRFRRIAAGDRLRGQYQALSQDPNSLSNLDQDLPNNMIHQVAIKSLPQEWLWCETWCDDDSKSYAKTIDLCNNPMTKEAKLTAAMRILPEWKGYDDDIRKLQQKIDSGLFDADDTETYTYDTFETEDSHGHTEL